MDDKLHTAVPYKASYCNIFWFKWMVMCKHGEKENSSTETYMTLEGFKFRCASKAFATVLVAVMCKNSTI
jgi:hypothetical protein